MLWFFYKDFHALFENRYPLQLRSTDHLPDELKKKLNNGYLVVSVRIQEANVSSPYCPDELALKKFWYKKIYYLHFVSFVCVS
jgi:hypothetical protein